MKKKLYVPANKQAIDINVLRPEDFKTAQEYDTYLSANWPGVIIHNLFILAQAMEQVRVQVTELNEGVEYLGDYCDALAGYESNDPLQKNKVYGH